MRARGLPNVHGAPYNTRMPAFITHMDFLGRFLAIVLLLASLGTWGLIWYKTMSLRTLHKVFAQSDRFWKSAHLEEGVRVLSQLDKTRLLTHLFTTCVHTVQQKQNLSTSMALDTRLHTALSVQTQKIQKQLDTGMTFLATVASSAPFVGLLGTVWGIYHTLLGFSQDLTGGNASTMLDRVAGPIGEALVMTALGLGVALPAVIAYNVFQKWGRQLHMQASAFSKSLYAYTLQNTALLERVKLDVSGS